MTAQISLEDFVKFLFKQFPETVKDTKEDVQGAYHYLVGLGIKYTKATVSIPELEAEIKKQLEENSQK